MRSVQFQTGNTDNRIIEKALPVRAVTLNPERSFMVNSRMTAFISLPFIQQGIQSDANIPNGNMRSVEALCRLSSSGIIAGGGSR